MSDNEVRTVEERSDEVANTANSARRFFHDLVICEVCENVGPSLFPPCIEGVCMDMGKEVFLGEAVDRREGFFR